jgi:hypothetical protein
MKTRNKVLLWIMGLTLIIAWTTGAVRKSSNWITNPDASFETRFTAETVSWISAYKDNYTGLHWEANPSTGTFYWSGNNSYREPTWDGSNYTYPSWRVVGDYPAFKRCVDFWGEWRLPTIEELYTLVSYTGKNGNNAYTLHPNISNNTQGYWTANEYPTTTTYALYVSFATGVTASTTKNSSTTNNLRLVVCVHD